jgi:hypothetical protein
MFFLDAFDSDPAPESVGFKQQDDDHDGKREYLFYPTRGETAQIAIRQILKNSNHQATHNGSRDRVKAAQNDGGEN